MNKIWATALLVPTVLGLTACTGSDETATQPETPAASSDFQYPTDPYSTSGIWAIPDDIAPGRYTVTPNSDPVISSRWYQLCVDKYCDKVVSGADKSDAMGYAEPSGGAQYVLIPADGSVQGIELTGVKLGAAE